MPVEEGTKLFYTVMGTGTPILILHGGPGLDHSYLLPQMAKLSGQYKLIFYDQRGTGRSGGSVDTESITLDKFIDDVEGVRASFNLDKVNLLGHSWGAMLAMLYAMKYPGHVHSLILADCSGASAEYLRQGNGIQKGRLTESERLVIATLTQMDTFKNRTPETMEEYFRILFRATFFDKKLVDSLTLAFTDATARNVITIGQLLFRGMENFDYHKQLSAITCPTLIIHGSGDAVPVEAALKIHKRIRNSQLVILQRSGHFPFIESPAEFFKAISDFLGRAEGPAAALE